MWRNTPCSDEAMLLNHLDNRGISLAKYVQCSLRRGHVKAHTEGLKLRHCIFGAYNPRRRRKDIPSRCGEKQTSCKMIAKTRTSDKERGDPHLRSIMGEVTRAHPNQLVFIVHNDEKRRT